MTHSTLEDRVVLLKSNWLMQNCWREFWITSKIIKLTEFLFVFILFFRLGAEWIRATHLWIDILNYCLVENLTQCLQKQCYNFIYKLLESQTCYDESFCNAVVKKITQPLVVRAIKYIN